MPTPIYLSDKRYPMALNDYQKEAQKTAIYPNDNNITYLALAVCGEAGELADKVKKVLRDKHGQFYKPDMVAIALELGDVMWYIANLAHSLGFKLEDIAKMNLDKIRDRVERGTLHGSGDNR